MINSARGLRRLAEDLTRQAVIGVDTESNSLYAYREQVCLLQFSTLQADYLVDPLAIKDLSPLAPVFADPRIEKVFHAAEYDIICLKRDFGFEFNDLFDTMVAATILGKNELGLGSILESEFGIQLDKRYQRADWSQRPLPPHLRAYARLDTHYLIQLRDRLKEELIESERWPLAEEDFNRLCNLNGRAAEMILKPAIDPVTEGCWRISGASELTPQQAAVLQELCRYRDQAARAHNRPLFKVIGDATLLAIAINLPANLEELSQLPGMSPGQVRRHGNRILDAVERGLQAPPAYPVRTHRPDEQFLSRVERLRQWRKHTAQKLGVKSDVILPRDLIQLLAEKNPGNIEDLQAVMQEVPWRFENFGGQILKILTQ